MSPAAFLNFELCACSQRSQRSPCLDMLLIAFLRTARRGSRCSRTPCYTLGSFHLSLKKRVELALLGWQLSGEAHLCSTGLCAPVWGRCLMVVDKADQGLEHLAGRGCGTWPQGICSGQAWLRFPWDFAGSGEQRAGRSCLPACVPCLFSRVV